MQAAPRSILEHVIISDGKAKLSPRISWRMTSVRGLQCSTMSQKRELPAPTTRPQNRRQASVLLHIILKQQQFWNPACGYVTQRWASCSQPPTWMSRNLRTEQPDDLTGPEPTLGHPRSGCNGTDSRITNGPGSTSTTRSGFPRATLLSYNPGAPLRAQAKMVVCVNIWKTLYINRFTNQRK